MWVTVADSEGDEGVAAEAAKLGPSKANRFFCCQDSLLEEVDWLRRHPL